MTRNVSYPQDKIAKQKNHQLNLTLRTKKKPQIKKPLFMREKTLLLKSSQKKS